MRRMDEKGVSPVIGVILMVAITVILAAVIASFVFGMSSNVKRTYNVAVTAQQNGDDIVVTLNGGPDMASLENITITAPSGCTWSGGGISGNTDTDPAVGDVYTCDGGGTDGRDHVVVVGTFADGSQQVLLDTYV
ncbi:type IV pilin [Archaeoglobus sp.]